MEAIPTTALAERLNQTKVGGSLDRLILAADEWQTVWEHILNKTGVLIYVEQMRFCQPLKMTRKHKTLRHMIKSNKFGFELNCLPKEFADASHHLFVFEDVRSSKICKTILCPWFCENVMKGTFWVLRYSSTTIFAYRPYQHTWLQFKYHINTAGMMASDLVV